MDANKLINLCQGHDIWIQTHNFPDPDAISSALGLQSFLSHFGINSRICYEGQIDKLSSQKLTDACNIETFPYSEIKDEMKESDYIVLVDSQKGNKNVDDFVGDEVASIDHHPVVVDTEYKYSDLRITGACASMITEYFKVMNIEPSQVVATALLYGIKMDTQQLSRGITTFDLDMVRFLFPFVDKELLNTLESNNMEFADLKAYGEAISNISTYHRVGFSHLNFACPDALVAILSDFILSLSEIDVVILYSVRPNGYKFSVRSERTDIDAGRMTHDVLPIFGKQADGGGHATMAGGFVPKEYFETYTDEDRNTAIKKAFTDYIRNINPDIL